MQLRALAAAAAVLALAASAPPPARGYTITLRSRTLYDDNVATLNANLGLTGAFVFEDFEDTTLLAGLQVAATGASIFDPSSNQTAVPPLHYSWTPVMTSRWGAGTTSDTITFTWAAGTRRFGVGLSDHDWAGAYLVSVNGQAEVDYTLLPNWFLQTGEGLNAYMVVDASEAEQPITSLRFRRNGTPEYIFFDHIAISVVPEPASAGLVAGVAIAGLVRRARSRRRT